MALIQSDNLVPVLFLEIFLFYTIIYISEKNY